MRTKKTNSLLVDGNNLMKIGFHGMKTYLHNNENIGGIWYFISTLRMFLEKYNCDKVIVFWDGHESWKKRRLIYSNYKLNRGESIVPEDEHIFYTQCNRVKQYLEEIYVRQIISDNCEADDLIAYYCKISENETKTIISSDSDLQQLVSEDVQVYAPMQKKMYGYGDKYKISDVLLPNYNIKTFKIICGDVRDNIDGISSLGVKTLVKLFPELLERKVEIDDILVRADELLKENKSSIVLKNILTGKTKTGIYGDEFYLINNKIINLDEPLLDDDVKGIIFEHYSDNLDPEGRDHKKLMKMMIDDGIFKLLPKADDAWVNFFKPFLKLSRKEKQKFNNKN